MMKRLFLLAAIAATLAMPALAQDMKPITLNDVPPHVIAAALAAANGVKFAKVQIEYEDGADIYEFSGKLPNGKAYEVDVFHDGAIEEVEEEIDMAAVPPAVRETLNRFLPNVQPSKIEKSTRANFSVWYGFDAKDARGKEIDVEISSDGQRILIQADEAG
jgi:hypothetical protein